MREVIVPNERRVIVHIAASADGYIARADGDMDWLTSRPAPKGFYGMNAFMKTIDALLMGRATYEAGLRLGGAFDPKRPTFVFSRDRFEDGLVQMHYEVQKQS